jgi:hypothetical protein
MPNPGPARHLQLSAKLTGISAKLDAIFGRFDLELRRAA